MWKSTSTQGQSKPRRIATKFCLGVQTRKTSKKLAKSTVSWPDIMHEAKVSLPVPINVKKSYRNKFCFITTIIHLQVLMSNSRTNDVTNWLLFLQERVEEGKRRRPLFLLLFSLQKGKPAATLRTWAPSDSAAGWKQDLRPRGHFRSAAGPLAPPSQSVRDMWGAPGEFGGNTPLSAMFNQCQHTRIIGSFHEIIAAWWVHVKDSALWHLDWEKRKHLCNVLYHWRCFPLLLWASHSAHVSCQPSPGNHWVTQE